MFPSPPNRENEYWEVIMRAREKDPSRYNTHASIICKYAVTAEFVHIRYSTSFLMVYWSLSQFGWSRGTSSGHRTEVWCVRSGRRSFKASMVPRLSLSLLQQPGRPHAAMVASRGGKVMHPQVLVEEGLPWPALTCMWSRKTFHCIRPLGFRCLL